jgi:negative regulator of sigma E activity
MNDDQKKKDEFAERWIDSALDRYSDAEPRPGFETRLLASIAAEREKRPRWRAMWMWAALGAAAAVLIAVIALNVSHRQNTGNAQNIAKANRPAGASAQSTTGSSVAPTVPPKRQRPQMAENSGARQMASHRRGITPQRKSGPRLALASTAPPKQPQFPTPAPLSEQERLLLAYVRATPKAEIENVIAEKQAFQKHVDSLGVPEEQEKSDR